MVSAGNPISRVCPSGGALATTSVPRMVAAPGRVSTITGWPRRSESSGAIVRATVSAALAAALGATMRRGRLGKVCGCAACGNHTISAIRAARLRTLVRLAQEPHPLVQALERQWEHPLAHQLPGDTNRFVVFPDRFGL